MKLSRREFLKALGLLGIAPVLPKHPVTVATPYFPEAVKYQNLCPPTLAADQWGAYLPEADTYLEPAATLAADKWAARMEVRVEDLTAAMSDFADACDNAAEQMGQAAREMLERNVIESMG